MKFFSQLLFLDPREGVFIYKSISDTN